MNDRLNYSNVNLPRISPINLVKDYIIPNIFCPEVMRMTWKLISEYRNAFIHVMLRTDCPPI